MAKKKILTTSIVSAAALLLGVARGETAASSTDRPVAYRVKHLASLGGSSSAGNSINDRGWVTGASNLAGDQIVHATLWRDGETIDLGTLGGANSAVLWPVKSVRGLVVGVSETDQVDPLGEPWSCGAFIPRSGKTCVGFVWQDGVMRALPTLGGNNGFAAGANGRGQVVGWAENTVHDPTCNPPQVLQFQAVVWGPGEGELRQLPPFPGDSVGAATAINDRGQVVGISGACGDAVGGVSAAHAVMWEHGRVRDLGNLGSMAWNTPMAINRHGVVVGFAGSDPGVPGFHVTAFIWTEEHGMQSLGKLHPTDRFSQALGVNDAGQVVGLSCGTICSAFIWQDGVMTELDELVEPGYPGHLRFANDINELGEISGGALDPATGERPAFLAVPLGERER